MKTHEMLNMDYAQLEQLAVAKLGGYKLYQGAGEYVLGHTIASAILSGYYIKLTKLGDKYQVDYGADSQPFDSFTDATQAFKQALDHAGGLEGLTDDQDMEQS